RINLERAVAKLMVRNDSKEIYTLKNPAGVTYATVRLNNYKFINLANKFYTFRHVATLDNAPETPSAPSSYSVEAGNFGNILAAYYAKRMGTPIDMLLCASNENRVLTDFINTGTYDVSDRPFVLTPSPSMDILISSNLERLLLAITQEDSEVRGYMEQLNATGRYQVSDRVREKIQKLFKGYCCGDEETKRVIAAIHEKFGYLIDPHTAVGFSALSQYRAETGDETAAIVASTASPFKFCTDVLDALGVSDRAQGLDVLDQLSQVTGEPVPAPLAALRSKESRFRQTVEKEHMVDAVLGMLE
ncbi:MAG: hypothetical protein EGR72_10610, partial [Clostridiales bacterium]|nr:hypothetical protein [Clostridiales bacterium]